MEDRTSACLMFDGFHDKKIIVLLNLNFKWRLVNETSHSCRLTRRQINWPVQWNIALVQADTQASQLTSAMKHRTSAGWHAGKSIDQRDWSRRLRNKFYRKLRKQKFFFSKLERGVFFNVCVWHKNCVSGKHLIRKTNTYSVCFL